MQNKQNKRKIANATKMEQKLNNKAGGKEGKGHTGQATEFADVRISTHATTAG
jgi:hypothetical protein